VLPGTGISSAQGAETSALRVRKDFRAQNGEVPTPTEGGFWWGRRARGASVSVEATRTQSGFGLAAVRCWDVPHQVTPNTRA
jgi:hypothetical protein